MTSRTGRRKRHCPGFPPEWCTFAAAGRHAQLWNTVTGQRFSLPILKSTGKSTTVELNLAPRESCFVVITDKAEQLPLAARPGHADRSETIEGPWDVYFDPKSGGPGHVSFPRLGDWTTNEDPGIKYYSGTAIYKKRITVDPSGDSISLDLGNPGFVARVFVNGRDAGIAWCAPWRLGISPCLKKGENDIEIHVANSLMNRMIYDAALPEDKRITYAYPIIASAGDRLDLSGLKEVKLIRHAIAGKNTAVSG